MRNMQLAFTQEQTAGLTNITGLRDELNTATTELLSLLQNSAETLDLTTEAFKAQIERLKEQIKDLEKKIENLRLAQNKTEIEQIKTSSSKWVPSVSLMAGYSFNKGNFGFITELGVDLTSSKVGKNDKESMEAEVKNIFHFYLTQKAGYRFTENTLTYITAGFGIKDYKAEYKGITSKLNVSESAVLPTFIIGAGYEHKLTNSIAVFTEFNHIMTLSKLKTEIGDFSMRSEQIKIGARWYF
jgi:opacity protein-like surface antigen